MSFDKMYNTVSNVLENINVKIANRNKYDGIMVKELKASNTLDKNRSTNQTHIAITSNQMDIFPYLRAEGYFSSEFDNRDEDLKKYFSLRIPINIYKDNCEYLEKSNTDNDIEIYFDSNGKEVFSHVVRSRRKEGADQVQLSFTSFDSQDFVNFRKLIHEGDYIVILKEKEKFSYEFYGVRKENISFGEESLKEYNGKFEKLSTNTFVSTKNIFDEKDNINNKPDTLKKGENIIYYGAPGTGKSHKVDKKSEEFDYVERVTFYPEYTHDDFIGCFMPVMNYEKEVTPKNYVFADGTPSTIKGKPIPYYSFVDGPFTKALVHALKNPNQNVLLIIEELNRANAAAVFGEVFQLLDRKYEGQANDGESRYEISISNEFSEFLASQEIPNYKKGDKIKIPCNLSIYATMNSADQGVNPLDSAFKRRWNFIYVPIDFNEVEHKDFEIDYAGVKVTWEVFATTINRQLKDKDINEDKHLGEYFVNKNEIADEYKFVSKILLYLFDDVLKFNRRGFFKTEYKTFSELLEGFNKGKEIFDFKFEIKTKNIKSQVVNDNNTEDNKTEPMMYEEQQEYGDSSRVAEESENEN